MSDLRRLLVALAAFTSLLAIAARPKISEDRELKEIDLKSWDCRDRPEGTAKTPDGVERNGLKNRPGVELAGIKPVALETASFLQHVAGFEAQAKNMRRKDLSATQKRQLEPLEKQIVSVEGYLVLAYAGPPESTNCGSMDFHDWHIEIFEKPQDHAPQIGDPTPIVCEITPRTQSGLFRDNVRIQMLAGFVRAPDMTIEPTGHAARKIRVTGYLLWDDEHNGSADVGTTIRSLAANGYHQPWRSTAWEIHPVIKIEAIDGAPVLPAASPPSAPPVPTPLPQASPSLAPTPPPQSQPQFVTITAPVKIKILYGETVIPRGTKVRVISHNATMVTVSYLDGTYAVPIASTDFH